MMVNTDMARGREGAPPRWDLWAPMGPRPPGGVGLLQVEGTQGPSPRRGTFGMQITDDKVFCKQVTDDRAGYRTKREPVQNFITLFSLE